MVATLRPLGLLGSLAFFAATALQRPQEAPDVVRALDAHYQAVFHDIALTKPTKWEVTDSKGRKSFIVQPAFLGNDRMVRTLVEGGHGMINNRLGHRASRTAAAKALVGWREWVFLVGSKTTRLTAENATVGQTVGWGAVLKGVPSKQYPTSEEALRLARMALANRPHSADSYHDEWTVSARPVVFENRRCLSCHVDSKLGDAAGVLVYALHRDPTRTLDREYAKR